jgi:NADH dehydrogenase/NADH:ubiquinone oxidoreductase subunit G
MMNMVRLEIDGQPIQAEEGSTLLEAASAVGIRIPTLCHHDDLKPYGACRLCMVEIQKGSRTRLAASCVYPVEEGLIVKTDTEKVRKIRRMIVELLWPALPDLAREYGLKQSRFSPRDTECNLCGLCVRYCAEVKKLHAAYFRGRGIDREVAVIPELAKECAFCRGCFDICTGGRIVNQSDLAFT